MLCNLNRLLKRFTLDTIWNAAFGVDTDTQNEKNNPYFEKCEKVFSDTADLDYIRLAGGKQISVFCSLNEFKIYLLLI